MNSDRIEFYKNQLRGVCVSELGRKITEILIDATNEAARDEREACAKLCEETDNDEHVVLHVGTVCAAAIRVRSK